MIDGMVMVDAHMHVARLSTVTPAWIFGTDWPGVPGVARNVRAVAALGLPERILAGVLSGNATQLYLRA